MKGIMGWIKSNLLIVVSTVVILVSLPVGWVISSGWNKDIREKQEKRANEAYNKIKNAKVTYVIPSLLPGEDAISDSRPPNPRVTEHVKALREDRMSKAQRIVGEVEGFNKDGHRLLATELLPAPNDPRSETRLKFEFLAKMGGDKQMGAQSIYNDLLSSIGAGSPPDPIRLATSIQDLLQRETERILAESGSGTMTPEQQTELRKVLRERRIAEAQRRAKEISIYADLSSFSNQAFGPDTAVIPPLDRRDRGTTTEPPTLADVYEWNFDYWVVSDLLRAIDRANTDSGGTRANVEHAAVKRIESIAVKSLPLRPAPTQSAVGGFGDPVLVDETESAGSDPSVSVTGRVSTEAYDVVPARLTLVVDSRRLPDIFRAFAETNLMTVIDADVSEVDVWDELRRGYFYGSDTPVVRVDLGIETVWLRSWTAPLMPKAVKEALGVVDADSADQDG